MNRLARLIALPALVAGLGASSSALAQSAETASVDGLVTGPGVRWQARLDKGFGFVPQSRVQTPLWLWAPQPASVGLMGDMALGGARLGASGGLRLSGGVLIHLHPRDALPGLNGGSAGWRLSGSGYAGVGYAGGSADGLWRFSADLGLTGLGFGEPDGITAPRNAPLGLSPLLRVGMRWSF